MGVEAADGNGASIEGAKALEDFDRGRFAGAVGPEQAEDFALFHGKTDTADGFDVAVALDEILYLENGFIHEFVLACLHRGAI